MANDTRTLNAHYAWGTGDGRVHIMPNHKSMHGKAIGCQKQSLKWPTTDQSMTVQEVKDTDFGICSFCVKWVNNATK